MQARRPRAQIAARRVRPTTSALRLTLVEFTSEVTEIAQALVEIVRVWTESTSSQNLVALAPSQI